MRSKRTGLRAVMVTQLVLLLPIMIAMLALVVDCANLSRCRHLRPLPRPRAPAMPRQIQICPIPRSRHT